MDAEVYQSKMSEMLGDEIDQRWEPDAYGQVPMGGSGGAGAAAAAWGDAPAKYGFDPSSGETRDDRRSSSSGRKSKRRSRDKGEARRRSSGRVGVDPGAPHRRSRDSRDSRRSSKRR